MNYVQKVFKEVNSNGSGFPLSGLTFWPAY